MDHRTKDRALKALVLWMFCRWVPSCIKALSAFNLCLGRRKKENMVPWFGGNMQEPSMPYTRFHLILRHQNAARNGAGAAVCPPPCYRWFGAIADRQRSTRCQRRVTVLPTQVAPSVPGAALRADGFQPRTESSEYSHNHSAEATLQQVPQEPRPPGIERSPDYDYADVQLSLR